MAKETYKRGLSIWQKRPTKEAYLYGKRDLQKKPIYMAKETCMTPIEVMRKLEM